MDSELTGYNEQEDEVGRTVGHVPFEQEESGEEWVVPGAPIVRTSTPRPLSFAIVLLPQPSRLLATPMACKRDIKRYVSGNR